MTAQVIFLNHYEPDFEQRRRNQILQDYITGARAGMNNRLLGLPFYMQFIEREKFHSYFRSKIKIKKSACQENIADLA